MVMKKECYTVQMMDTLGLDKLTIDDLHHSIDQYISTYTECFTNVSQSRYFSTFVKGVLNVLDRKSIEPIALAFMDEKAVRPMQYFFTRVTGIAASLRKNCQTGVFPSYASEKGYGLTDSRLYLPKKWFLEDFKQQRLKKAVFLSNGLVVIPRLAVTMIFCVVCQSPFTILRRSKKTSWYSLRVLR